MISVGILGQISSSSKARKALSRSPAVRCRARRSLRSRSAFRIAPVLDSPVNAAISFARRSVSSSLIFSAMVESYENGVILGKDPPGGDVADVYIAPSEALAEGPMHSHDAVCVDGRRWVPGRRACLETRGAPETRPRDRWHRWVGRKEP